MHLRILTSSVSGKFDSHKRNWRACTQCDIGYMSHHKVFTRGVLPCDILFAGEAPGQTEDATGWPFVGRSGKLLEEWINCATADMAVSYAVTNTVLCRPTDKIGGVNRAPTPKEITNCTPRLAEFVLIANPRAVVTLGKPAMEHVTRLQLAALHGLPLLHLRHPAYILRNGGSGSWMDTQEKTKLANFVSRVFTQKEATRA